ncbi:MAG: asparagine synthase (glutamine-hydrolyzing) [Rhodospirillaceae bacterium TMED8]|nr:asparagine synthase (glutamine-hydrolyzing) [Magnetovibrio sp.]OUT50755.1 MAG: asparagine synthase (glutamine-hydrolyzing) [Rhodospirillaceae bacterium TMED8]
MCGIAGILSPINMTPPKADELRDRLIAMTHAMVHRGPDGHGTWISDNSRIGFGHRRLAIIDLSEEAAQPMSNGDNSIWITYNGEIYNHAQLRIDLKVKGYEFRTQHSDTETLVHGYHAWGLEGLVDRLDGMFAFAIWDSKLNKLLLARDRVGIKPLYFTQIGGQFRFASEIKAILTDPLITREIDNCALNHYLSFMITPAPLTLFKGIYKLPASHILEVDSAGRACAKRYWDAAPTGHTRPKIIDHSKTYAAGIRDHLASAIEKRMMSDVPIGVFLSGGIDSSVNVSLMREVSKQPIETFTVGFSDYEHLNELNYARLVAKEFKTNHHEVLINSEDMQGYLEDLVHHQDEPIADWVCVPLYFVSKLARDNGIKVVQVGEGSDEQFCGYDSWMTYLKFYRNLWNPYCANVPQYLRTIIGKIAIKYAPTGRDAFAQGLEALLRAGQNQELFWSGANAFWNVHKHRILEDFGSPGEYSELADMGFNVNGLASSDSGDVAKGYLEALDKDCPDSDMLTRMIYAEFRLRLPELLLMRVDKVTMSQSIEGRVPFLDQALVEYTMNIPQSAKLGSANIKKHVLKEAVQGLIPNQIIHRPKMGFSAPVADWLCSDFGAETEKTIMRSTLVSDGPLNGEYISRLFQEHRSKHSDHALHIWTLHNLINWHDHWIS